MTLPLSAARPPRPRARTLPGPRRPAAVGSLRGLLGLLLGLLLGGCDPAPGPAPSPPADLARPPAASAMLARPEPGTTPPAPAPGPSPAALPAAAPGAAPITTYAATAAVPEGIDEFMLAGCLRRKPGRLVRCVTCDLEVPAESQFVIEGFVRPGEMRREGPFGDHTGFYSPADDYPVFHVTAITRRSNPIYPATIVGRPPMEDGLLGKVTERLFLPLIRQQMPEIVDMNLPVEGVFHNLCFVAIDKRYPGHAQKVMHALWGLGQMMFTKMIFVFDAEVDVQNVGEVLFHLGGNVDPGRDLTVVRGPVDALDHAAPLPNLGTKMGVDCTRKWSGEGYEREWPELIRMSDGVRAKIDHLWSRLKL